MGLRGLQSQLESIEKYLHDIVRGTLPINHHVIYYVQEVLNLLPDVTHPDYVVSQNVQTNDQLMCVHMGSLVRSVVALHNLIDNKIALQKAEKEQETGEAEKKKEEKDKKDEKKDEKKEGTASHRHSKEVQTEAYHCLGNVHFNLPVNKVTVHPLVLLSVVDHFNRVSKTQSVKRVVGVLLGSMKKDKTLDIGNSFAVPFDEDDKDKNTWFLDMDYLESMYGMFYKTDHLIVALITFNVVALSFLFAGVFYIHRRNKERCEETQLIVKNELRARIAKVGAENRKLIFKGMRREELAVTAAVSSALKVEKSSSNRKAMTELDTALANLFAAQQTRIEEQFEENQRILRDALTEGRRSRADDTLSVEDSESSSETEQSKEDTPTLD